MLAPKLKETKNLGLIAVFLVLLAVAGVATSVGNPVNTETSCGPYRNDRILRVGTHRILTEVASTPAAQIRGLGGRGCIPSDAGMLFPFNKPGYYPFWMKDMQFPIDIIWLGADHKVVTVYRNITPSTYPNTFVNNGRPAQYVLELPADKSKSLGISPGTPVNF